MAQSHRRHKRCAETLIELHLTSRFANYRHVMVNTITNLFCRSVITVSAMVTACSLAKAQGTRSSTQYKTESNILYRTGGNLTDYMKERCRLDVYHPVGKEGYPTIVWFHGGGLKAGNRSAPPALKKKGGSGDFCQLSASPQGQVACLRRGRCCCGRLDDQKHYKVRRFTQAYLCQWSFRRWLSHEHGWFG